MKIEIDLDKILKSEAFLEMLAYAVVDRAQNRFDNAFGDEFIDAFRKKLKAEVESLADNYLMDEHQDEIKREIEKVFSRFTKAEIVDLIKDGKLDSLPF